MSCLNETLIDLNPSPFGFCSYTWSSFPFFHSVSSPGLRQIFAHLHIHQLWRNVRIHVELCFWPPDTREQYSQSFSSVLVSTTTWKYLCIFSCHWSVHQPIFHCVCFQICRFITVSDHFHTTDTLRGEKLLWCAPPQRVAVTFKIEKKYLKCKWVVHAESYITKMKSSSLTDKHTFSSAHTYFSPSLIHHGANIVINSTKCHYGNTTMLFAL